MTDTVQIALIALGSAAIAAIPPTIVAWRTGQRVDGRLTQLLESKDAREKATAISSRAMGVLDEKERHKIQDANFHAGRQFEFEKKEKGATDK
jgi:hypothetical protein